MANWILDCADRMNMKKVLIYKVSGGYMVDFAYGAGPSSFLTSIEEVGAWVKAHGGMMGKIVNNPYARPSMRRYREAFVFVSPETIREATAARKCIA